MIRLALAALACTAGAANANAATYLLDWSGFENRVITYGGPGGGHEDYLSHEIGSGFIDLIDNPTPNSGLGNVAAFGFSTTMDFSDTQYPTSGRSYVIFSGRQTNTYGLSDLYLFDGGSLTGGSGNLSFVLNGGKGPDVGELIYASPDGNVTNTGELFHPTGPLRVTLATSGVPEPSSWVLMILGFGAVGYASRRRRAAFG